MTTERSSGLPWVGFSPTTNSGARTFDGRALGTSGDERPKSGGGADEKAGLAVSAKSSDGLVSSSNDARSPHPPNAKRESATEWSSVSTVATLNPFEDFLDHVSLDF